MKLLFLGLLYRMEEEDIILSNSKCGLQGAANTYQWNLIHGLEEVLEKPVDILNSLPVGSYPRNYKKLCLPFKQWSHRKGAEDEEIGGINIPILKQLMRYFAVKRKLKAWCRKYANEDLVVISYSMYLPYLKALTDSKKRYPALTTCLIIPDLPNAFGLQKPGNPGTIAKRYLEKLQYQAAKTADAHILLTKKMAIPLGITGKPYVIVEGICKEKEPDTRMLQNNSSAIIFYAGTLNQRFGLDRLIDAFHKIKDENYQLWICGSGDYQEEIEKAAKLDQRITYYGYVTASRLCELQEKATLFINPRPNDEEYTKYSFPSKTMEYMVSGRPVLMCKLDGIPDEYDDYLYYIRENTADSIKKAILSVTGKSREELEHHVRSAYEFVIGNKNGRIQAGKVLKMLQTVMEQSKTSNHKIKYKKKKVYTNEDNLGLVKMKVLQINITCQYGSTGTMVEQLHGYLAKKGCHSFVAYSAYHSNLINSFPMENTLEHYLRRALNRYVGRKYIHSAPGTLHLIRKIKQIKPDVIHLHNIQQNSTHFPMLMKFLRRYGVPVVYTLHDCWAFTGGCYHFTQLGCDGYRTGCLEGICKLPMKERDLCNQTTKQIYEEKKALLSGLSDLCIVCVSHWLKSCAEQSFMKNLKLMVIYNGIDTDIFHPVDNHIREELGIAENEYLILGVANHWANKGLNSFIELSRVLKTPSRIVLVGLSKPEEQENMITLPRIAQASALAKIYCCADVYFNASREESFGLTTAEAMACGTPVIAYRSTAGSELVNENTGILLNSDSQEELVTAIETIKNRGKNYYSRNCISHVKENFSRDTMLKSYMSLYEEMINKQQQGNQ